MYNIMSVTIVQTKEQDMFGVNMILHSFPMFMDF